MKWVIQLHNHAAEREQSEELFRKSEMKFVCKRHTIKKLKSEWQKFVMIHVEKWDHKCVNLSLLFSSLFFCSCFPAYKIWFDV